MPFEPVTLISVIACTAGISIFAAAVFAATWILPLPTIRRTAHGDCTISHRFSGLAIFLLSLTGAFVLQVSGLPLALLARHFWSLFIAANVLAWPVALALLFAAQRKGPPSLSQFFFGANHNPHLVGIDLKMFSYRCSLIGLALMNLSFASQQWEEARALTLAMAMYQAFTLIYVANYFQFEHGMLFTWDIIEERFGWMLVWGDYVVVPFFYCVPGFYVFWRPDPMTVNEALMLASLFSFGFWLFRGANGQKHRFKTSPAVRIWGRSSRALEGHLLVSGFWGIGRKLNYTGELIMYVAWTLACGFHSLVPYLLPAWLAGLLMQRAARDDRRCRAKYGPVWDEYCRHARFRMFPYLY